MSPTDILAALDQIQARADAATKGPWTHTQPWAGFAEIRCDQGIVFAVANPNAKIGDRLVPSEEMDANLALATHARTDIPRLVAALRVAVEFITGDEKCRCQDCCDIIAAQIEKVLERKSSADLNARYVAARPQRGKGSPVNRREKR